MKFNAKKFLSRKFLIALVGIIVGLAVSLGADASEIQQVAGAVVSAISAVGYIFGEAMVDAAAAKPEDTPVIVEVVDTDELDESDTLKSYADGDDGK